MLQLISNINASSISCSIHILNITIKQISKKKKFIDTRKDSHIPLMKTKKILIIGKLEMSSKLISHFLHLLMTNTTDHQRY